MLEGSRRIKVTERKNVVPLLDERKTIEAGKSYTYIVYEASQAVTSILQEDDNTAPEEGEFKLRVGHFSPNAGAVDLYIYHLGDNMDEVDPALTNVSAGSFSEYLEIDEDRYRIKFTETGTDNVVLDAGELNLRAGDVATLILLDQEQGGEPFTSALMLDREN